MEIITFFLVLATICLVIVTWLYTRHTKRIADVKAQEFEYKISPVVITECGSFTTSGRSPNSKIQFPITITNAGSYVCFLKNIKFICSLRSNPQTNYSQAIEHLTDESTLPPKVPISLTVNFQGQEWMIDHPRNYIFSIEMELAGIDHKFKKLIKPFTKFP